MVQTKQKFIQSFRRNNYVNKIRKETRHEIQRKLNIVINTDKSEEHTYSGNITQPDISHESEYKKWSTSDIQSTDHEGGVVKIFFPPINLFFSDWVNYIEKLIFIIIGLNERYIVKSFSEFFYPLPSLF